jgi:hypothetical protein
MLLINQTISNCSQQDLPKLRLASHAGMACILLHRNMRNSLKLNQSRRSHARPKSEG